MAYKEWAKRFYNSKPWLLSRASYISYRVSIDGGACERCEDDLGYIVDHITELTHENINNPDIALNHDNLQYLCLSCHNKKTFGSGQEVTRDDVMFNELGELIAR